MKKIIAILLLLVAFVPFSTTTASSNSSKSTLQANIKVLEANNQLLDCLLDNLEKNRNPFFQAIGKCTLKPVVASALRTRSKINTAELVRAYGYNSTEFAIATNFDLLIERSQQYLNPGTMIPS